MIKSDRPDAVFRILFRTTACLLLVGLGLIAANRPAVAQGAPPQAKSIQRTLFVPFNDLAVILGGENERVFLERTEFDRLRKLAKKNPVERAPRAAWLTHADYRVAINGSIADILADVKVEVLEPGWHTVPLKLSGVQLQHALFDDQTALLGRSGDGSVLLFVHGIGTHSLKMKITT